MPRKRTSIALLSVIVASMLAAGPVHAATVPAGSLFVQQADGGKIVRSGGRWRLVLRKPSPVVTTFSDRPVRVGSSEPLRAFVSGWRGQFGSDQPNAALEVPGAPPSRDVLLLELSPPRRAAGRLVYAVRPLTKTSSRQLARLARRADRPTARAFGRATLFIDDASQTVAFDATLSIAPNASFAVDFDDASVVGGALTEFTAGNVVEIVPTGFAGQGPDAGPALLGLVQGRIQVPSGGAVTGTATIPPGSSVALSLGGGPATTLANGPFSIPIPGS